MNGEELRLIMDIKRIESHEIGQVRNLIWNAFNEFVAKDCTVEGINIFRNDLRGDEFFSDISLYGAYINGELAGVVGTKMCDSHISLLFVDKRFHSHGIGRRLVNLVINRCILPKITVNASPYAHDFYKKMGFVDYCEMREVGGVRHYPMVLNTMTW